MGIIEAMSLLPKSLHPYWMTFWRLLPSGVRYRLAPIYNRHFRRRMFVVFWPTFRCNYTCSYCPVHTKFDFTTVYPKTSEKGWEQWVEALEKLPPADFYFAGGEPFLYAGLPELINHLPDKHGLDGIVSNLSMPTAVFRKLKTTTHINASFHRECVSSEAFIDKVKELQKSFDMLVNIVATPENLPTIEAIDKMLGTHNISLHVDPFIDAKFSYSDEQKQLLENYLKKDRSELPNFDDYTPKSCSAGRRYINLLPNGDVYACASGFSFEHSPLFADVVKGRQLPPYRLGNLFDTDFKLNEENLVCAFPCQAYCDRDHADIETVSISPVGRAQ